MYRTKKDKFYDFMNVQYPGPVLFYNRYTVYPGTCANFVNDDTSKTIIAPFLGLCELFFLWDQFHCCSFFYLWVELAFLDDFGL